MYVYLVCLYPSVIYIFFLLHKYTSSNYPHFISLFTSSISTYVTHFFFLSFSSTYWISLFFSVLLFILFFFHLPIPLSMWLYISPSVFLTLFICIILRVHVSCHLCLPIFLLGPVYPLLRSLSTYLANYMYLGISLYLSIYHLPVSSCPVYLEVHGRLYQPQCNASCSCMFNS